MASTDGGRAAQYVRMSTGMQQYSIANQSDAIAVYAARRGLALVQSYEDSGKSGLRLAGRGALKALIDDVKSGRADFETILVYDVSRWGRFQDSDESAYYEFICKEAGVAVHYCAEEFENDGSLIATIIKNIKRAMAGEYSRELSTKVFAGQSRIISLGYNAGASPGYGLRRFLLDEQGNRKLELATGQRKSVKTERVVFGLGPAHELRTIEYVYGSFIEQKNSLATITRDLNAQGILNVMGRPWSTMAVRQLLSNEKYIGNNVYNRGSKKLGRKWRPNPRHEWIRASQAFEGVVTNKRFAAAQNQLRENASHYTDNQLLDFLTAVWCREKRLSSTVIQADPNAPSDNTFKQRFGGLSKAFRRVGYTNGYIDTRETTLNLRRAICADILEQVTQLGGSVRDVSRRQYQILVNEEFTVTVVLGRTAPVHLSGNENHWRFGYRSQQKPDILIVARIETGSTCIRDYFVLPFLFLPPGSWLTVSGLNYRRLEGFRCMTLAPFFELCARRPLSTGFR